MTTPYPPTQITTPDDTLNILQLTDLHLYADVNQETAGVNNQQSFTACLQQALSEDRRCDLILITGDLVNEVATEIYDRIFDELEQTGIPFACIAGNHDVTDEVYPSSPSDADAYANRHYVGHAPDVRLLSQHVIKANDWRVLLLDSSVSGYVYGRVGKSNLTWLAKQLEAIHAPVIIVLHHHVLPMSSAWINKHITKDAETFWQVIADSPEMESTWVKAVVTGHVHQHYSTTYHGVEVYATPSTCYQFKPDHDAFAYDEEAKPGYRWLQLKPNGELVTFVNRLG